MLKLISHCNALNHLEISGCSIGMNLWYASYEWGEKVIDHEDRISLSLMFLGTGSLLPLRRLQCSLDVFLELNWEKTLFNLL